MGETDTILRTQGGDLRQRLSAGPLNADPFLLPLYCFPYGEPRDRPAALP